eukprot:1150545-Pelagomonas_calceolata.AAC.4
MALKDGFAGWDHKPTGSTYRSAEELLEGERTPMPWDIFFPKLPQLQMVGGTCFRIFSSRVGCHDLGHLFSQGGQRTLGECHREMPWEMVGGMAWNTFFAIPWESTFWEMMRGIPRDISFPNLPQPQEVGDMS